MISIASFVWGIGFAFFTYAQLPETVALHFDMNGKPDRFGSRLEAGWILLMLPAVALLLNLIFLWASKNENRQGQKKILLNSSIGMNLLLVLVQFLIVQSMQTSRFDDARLLVFGVGALLLLLGNLMPKASPNPYAGVRLPYTLASDRSWYATNRLGGYLFASMGLLLLLLGLLLPKTWIRWLLLSSVLILLGGVIYLWFYAKKVYFADPERRPL
ncbi:MAG: SdpI family protein [Deinococcales bacterium]